MLAKDTPTSSKMLPRDITDVTAPTEVGTMPSGGACERTGAHMARRRLGKFSIDATIGSGGMSTVLEATDCELGRRVALKRMQVLDSRSDDFLLAEAIRLAKVKHPNVVEVHEVIKGDGDERFVVLEFVDGPTLATWQTGQSPKSILAVSCLS